MTKSKTSKGQSLPDSDRVEEEHISLDVSDSKLNFELVEDAEDNEFAGFESTDDEDDKTFNELNKEKDGPTIDKIKRKSAGERDVTGVVYVGRIPHGFYETEMYKYFSQFGKILQMRLCRNKRTGASKHFGFIEFNTPAVADIVCETMNNYLLFGHLLKVIRVPPEKVHRKLFGPHSRLLGRRPPPPKPKARKDRKRSREEWAQIAAELMDYRKRRAQRLKSLGIDY